MQIIRPMPSKQGIGFFSPHVKLPDEFVSGYRYEHAKTFHNYHATSEAWEWPTKYPEVTNFVIDAFSPNLNKQLHVGHLRQLIIAASLNNMIGYNNKFVAMLGASIGVIDKSIEDLKKWFKLVNYNPEIYYDNLLPNDLVIMRDPTSEDIAKAENLSPDKDGCYPKIWDGPNGPVIVQTSTGKNLYTFHDLSFAALVHPTHYITDHGQKEHFVKLGFGDKFYGMGLVLGPDPDNPNQWTKYRSRSGEVISATECVNTVIGKLDSTEMPEKLAWNVLTWNFLHCSRSKDVKFEIEKWTSPDSPGLYITYTWARVNKALLEHGNMNVIFGPMSERSSLYYSYFKKRKEDLHPIDIELIAFADQHKYWYYISTNALDSSSLANFTHELARKLGNAYHQEQIRDGRVSFQAALQFSNLVLKRCMAWLGMFRLTSV